MKKIKVLELFGGISAPYKALINIGIDAETVDYVEVDKKVVSVRNAIFNSDYIAKSVVDYHYNGKVDLLIGGSPCTDFSKAGASRGGVKGSGTKSSLMWEQVRIISEVMPKVTIWENVESVINKSHKETYQAYCDELSELGYTNFKVIANALDFGLPLNRVRVFTISILNANKDIIIDIEKFRRHITDEEFQELINNNILDEYSFAEEERKMGEYKQINPNEKRKLGYFKKDFLERRVYNIDNYNYFNCLTTSHHPYYKKDDKLYKLNSYGCLKVMGFDKSDYDKVSDITASRIQHVCGNSISVTVLEAIFKSIYLDNENI